MTELSRRAQACIDACDGISTDQLEAMNATDIGLLSRAYDVCSVLWEYWGIEFVTEDDEIPGSEAVDSLLIVSDDIEAVVQWARDAGTMQ